MRSMSFALTTPQILGMSKWVTRRVGWTFVQPGDRLRAVKRCQGLKKGEKQEQLAVLRVLDVRREPLDRLIFTAGRGRLECIAEGFPDLTGTGFVEMFCASHRGCTPDTEVTRVRFGYEEPALPGWLWEPTWIRRYAATTIVLRTPTGREAAYLWTNGTWHTWDVDGIGGENSQEGDVAAARDEAIAAVVRQARRRPAQWHGDELPAEVPA